MSYFKKLGPRLLAQGYTIVPIPRGSKGPQRDGWRDLRLTVDEFEAWCAGTWVKTTKDGESRELPNVRETDGLGINTTHTPAVDIDEYDQEVVGQMVAFMRDNLDAIGPKRIGRAPKSLFLFRTETPFAKVQSATWKDSKGRACKTEILGDGQQFVAYHVHPDTQRPYVWPDEWESPVDIKVSELPVLTETDAKVICSFFDKLCSEAGRQKVGEASSGGDDSEALAREAPPPETDYEIARVKKSLEHISPDCSRSEYLAVLAGLKWTGWMCAEELAHEWAEKSEEDKFNERDFQRDWKSLDQERVGKRTTTLGSVISMAVKGGFDASRKDEPKLTPEESKALFDGLMDRAQSLVEGDRAGVKELIKAIADAGLDGMDEVALLRVIAKKAKVGLVDLKHGLRDEKQSEKKAAEREHGEPTHANYAKRLLDHYEDEHGSKARCVEGDLWLYDGSSGLWKPKSLDAVSVEVAVQFDGMEHVVRENDYVGIAKHALKKSAIGSEKFFDGAPIGMACEGRFYHIEDGEITREKLCAAHRQRFGINVAPKVMETPMWDKLMADAFEGDNNREQELLMEEFLGGALLGVTQRMQKVMLFLGVERSGKSTIQNIIKALAPDEFFTAVEPAKWDDEKQLVAFSKARFNFVGEMTDEAAIKGAEFKRVVGQDPILARALYKMPYTFIPKVAHLFLSNFFVPTKDRSEAFFSRWIIIEFRNSMLKREKDIDIDLQAKIIESELPGIAARLLKGAQRLIERGKFKMTPQHHRKMDLWKKRASSFMEFLNDSDYIVVNAKGCERAKDIHAEYARWCKESHRNAMSKEHLFDALRESSVVASMGIRLTTLNGYNVVRGVSLRSKMFDAEVKDMDDDDDDY